MVGNEKKDDLSFNGIVAVGIERAKYLGVLFNEFGNSGNRVNKDRNMIRTLNSVFCFKW